MLLPALVLFALVLPALVLPALVLKNSRGISKGEGRPLRLGGCIRTLGRLGGVLNVLERNVEAPLGGRSVEKILCRFARRGSLTLRYCRYLKVRPSPSPGKQSWGHLTQRVSFLPLLARRAALPSPLGLGPHIHHGPPRTPHPPLFRGSRELQYRSHH